MVVMDSTMLLLLFQSDARPPIDPTTNLPLEKCKERIDFLIQSLTDKNIEIAIPTPVLSEILVAAGPDKSKILDAINSFYAFSIKPFDQLAAVEVAMLTDKDLDSNKKLNAQETKAKVKYDRQIVAIAKVNNLKTIYSDDRGLAKVARANGINVIQTADLPVPPEPPQKSFEFAAE